MVNQYDSSLMFNLSGCRSCSRRRTVYVGRPLRRVAFDQQEIVSASDRLPKLRYQNFECQRESDTDLAGAPQRRPATSRIAYCAQLVRLHVSARCDTAISLAATMKGTRFRSLSNSKARNRCSPWRPSIWGIKSMTPHRMAENAGCRVHVVPSTITFDEPQSLNP